MKRLQLGLVTIAALLSFTGSAMADNDCCFDTRFKDVLGKAFCKEAPGIQANGRPNCWDLCPGIQIFVPDYDCDTSGGPTVTCDLKGGAGTCEYTVARGVTACLTLTPTGCTSGANMIEPNPMPTVSSMSAFVLAGLMVLGGAWMIRRQRLALSH